MKRKKNGKIPKLKKDIKDFLLSEEGKITKKDIAKIGMTLAVLTAIFTPSKADGHASYISNPSSQGRHTSHSSHGSHGSHASHGSHCNSSGSWC